MQGIAAMRSNPVNQEYKRHQSFPLRLSPSIRQQATELARDEGISLNHFISLAIAEKLSRMEQASLRAEQAKQKSSHLLVPRLGFEKRA